MRGTRWLTERHPLKRAARVLLAQPRTVGRRHAVPQLVLPVGPGVRVENLVTGLDLGGRAPRRDREFLAGPCPVWTEPYASSRLLR
jgi:hypothetical protein